MMKKLNNPKIYALVTGLVLFSYGIIKFAFRGASQLPDYILLFSIIFGFWGILTVFGKKE